MRVLFYLGWVFLVLAFAAAAAEAIPRAMPGGDGVFISAYDLWYAAWPGSLVVTQIQVEKLSPALWDPVIVGVLALPGWLLFGGPGVFLVWFCRPFKQMTKQELEDLQKQEESLHLFERLSREAEEAGYTDGDDQLPDHAGHELLESGGGVHPHSEDAVIRDLEFEDTDLTGGNGGGGRDGNGSGGRDGNGGGDEK